MNIVDTLNLAGLVLDGSAAVTLLCSAPIPQRGVYFVSVEQVNEDTRKDRRTRIVHRIAMSTLVLGILLQLSAQLMR